MRSPRLFDPRDPAADRRSHQTNRRLERQQSEKMGRIAELLAAGLLVMKGYRIVARRVRSHYGELDLIAVRGRRLAFVEVKYRETLQAALMSVSDRQATRMAEAAEKWMWQHPAYRDHDLGLDAIYLAPWQLPRHLINGLQPH